MTLILGVTLKITEVKLCRQQLCVHFVNKQQIKLGLVHLAQSFRAKNSRSPLAYKVCWRESDSWMSVVAHSVISVMYHTHCCYDMLVM